MNPKVIGRRLLENPFYSSLLVLTILGGGIAFGSTALIVVSVVLAIVRPYLYVVMLGRNAGADEHDELEALAACRT